MKKIPHILIVFTALASVCLFSSWGTFGHEHINRAAVLALPDSMRSFFFNHIDYITQESTVPDLRKYTMLDKTETPRHYIDLEKFGPIDSVPKSYAEATLKYKPEFLNEFGILPWYIQDMMEKLTKAFKGKRKTEILFLAADLAHYIGDAHMPLHTSINHDGQLTDQRGIHALWESRLPEMFGSYYDYHVKSAIYIKDIQKHTWDLVLNSFKLADTVLLTDRNLRATMAKEKIFKLDEKGAIKKNKFNQNIFTDDYSEQYHEALNGMIEKQMRAAIICTSSYWYTAWVNAGKPDLGDLDPAYVTQKNEAELLDALRLLKYGKLTGIESEKEF
ncbi:MAG TPA: zinc dependent phospholipase C family protein [Bacteroidia bacterium]|jgi:hypothetical protein|nr:zinc dependent phospholipase C family protein [Bacteroidia bacterium]